MLVIREVKTKKEQKEFIDFPLNLYKDNDCFVPPLYGDEKKIFRKDYVYNDTCDAVYFNAYRDGKIVGRISGIETGRDPGPPGRSVQCDDRRLCLFRRRKDADPH